MSATTGFLSLPQLSGCEQLRAMVHAYGGHEKTANTLRVRPELLHLWLTGEVDPPYHFLVAVWFASPFGFQQAFSESHWAHQQNTLLKNQARRQNELLKQALASTARHINHQHPQLAQDLIQLASDALAPDVAPSLTEPAFQALEQPMTPKRPRAPQRRADRNPEAPYRPGYARQPRQPASTDPTPRKPDR